VDGRLRRRIARLHADGRLDEAFDPGLGPNLDVWALAPAHGGKVLIAGSFTYVNGVSRNRVARLNPDGSLDRSFDPGAGADNQVFAMAVHKSGKIFLGGSFSRFAGLPRDQVARLHNEPLLFDPQWNAGGFSASVAASFDEQVILEFKDSLLESNWTAVPAPGVLADETRRIFTDPLPANSQRFYRVRLDPR
jgi:hypothetical protein